MARSRSALVRRYQEALRRCMRTGLRLEEAARDLEQITDEKDVWRLVRDIDGEEGWIHRVMLSGTRTVIVAGATMATAYDRPDAASAPVFRAEPGVIAKLGPCEGGWCQVTVAGTRGWMAMGTLWGVDPQTAPE